MSKIFTGTIYKMPVTLASPVEYVLPIGEQHIAVNALLGNTIKLTYLEKINCIQCDRETSKSFQQGYCFPCYRQLLACNLCIIHPERCLYYEGKCQAEDWAHRQCGASHIIYLANTSGLKVGITRETNVPMRWIDQGAIQAVPIMRVQNRYQAGVIEVALKNYVADITNWRKMLQGGVEPLELLALRDNVLSQGSDDIKKAWGDLPADECQQLDEATVVEINYPVQQYPTKITSLSFDKTAEISGRLLGVKGQYLILDVGVLNIRKFGGYQVELVC